MPYMPNNNCNGGCNGPQTYKSLNIKVLWFVVCESVHSNDIVLVNNFNDWHTDDHVVTLIVEPVIVYL